MNWATKLHIIIKFKFIPRSFYKNIQLRLRTGEAITLPHSSQTFNRLAVLEDSDFLAR